MAGVSRLYGRYVVTRPAPRYHVVLMSWEGRGKLETEAGETSLDPGGLCFIPSGVAYRYGLAGASWSMGWFHLARRKRWREVAVRGVQILDFPDADVLSRVMESAMDAPEREAQLSLELVIRRVARALEPDPAGISETERRMNLLRVDVESDLAAPWTITALARRMHVSAPHLHRLALAFWGAPPMRFVATARMERARTLLLNTDLTIAQVAAIVGYGDAFSFSTAFRRHSGRAPSRARKSL